MQSKHYQEVGKSNQTVGNPDGTNLVSDSSGSGFADYELHSDRSQYAKNTYSHLPW
jgi:hypothetical protein